MNNKLQKILGHTTVEANCCTDENLELMGKGDESLDKIDSEKYDDFFNHVNALGSGTLLRPGKLSKLSVRENFKLFKHDNDGNLVPNSSRERNSKKGQFIKTCCRHPRPNDGYVNRDKTFIIIGSTTNFSHKVVGRGQ